MQLARFRRGASARGAARVSTGASGAMALRPAELVRSGAAPAGCCRPWCSALGAVGGGPLGGWLFTAVVLVAVVIMAREWARPDRGRALAAARGRRPRPLSPCSDPGARCWVPPATAAGDHAAGPAARCRHRPAAAQRSADQVAGGAFYVGLPTLSLVWLRNGVAGGPASTSCGCCWSSGRRTSAPISSAGRSAARSWRRGSARARPGPACSAGWAAPACWAGSRPGSAGAGFWFAAPGCGTVLAVVAPGRRPVRIDAEAPRRGQGQRPSDPRSWRTARPDRRAGLRGAGVRRHRLARRAGAGMP